MRINESEAIILTLDAGGTNFVFSAMQQGEVIGDLVRLPASTTDDISCTKTIIQGFELLKQQIQKKIAAISFAFPGPADYKNGIIGDLPNFPGINGNYPLKSILENHFNCPVFINNDGDLFTYGEALVGSLVEINAKLKESGSPKIFLNLIGITLGTGIGNGIVINGTLLIGDNSSGGEIHNMSNPYNNNWNIEESVSTRAIQRVYAEKAGILINKELMPKQISEIALGEVEGNKKAAIHSFKEYGKALGFVISNIITLIDGIVVIGGGITGAWDLFAPSLFEALNAKYQGPNGNSSKRTTVKIFNLEDEAAYKVFLNCKIENIQTPTSKIITVVDTVPRTGIIRSKKGASVSTSLGAYHFAISQFNKD